ncbi:MAG: hypothetical protein IKE43_07735 [Coriobacteriales bacterium]|nr:hypothetical protein [Coriobacteriales bacterium]
MKRHNHSGTVQTGCSLPLSLLDKTVYLASILMVGAAVMLLLGFNSAPAHADEPTPTGTDYSMDFEPEPTGMHRSNTDHDASKEIQSTAITSFYLSFYGETNGGGTYKVIQAQDQGQFILVKDSDTRSDEPENPIALTQDDVAGLEALVREYQLAELNGVHEQTDGLPNCDGDFSLKIEYASGESIDGDANGGLGGLPREGFDAIKLYLERFFILNGDVSEIQSLYPPERVYLSLPGTLPGLEDYEQILAEIYRYDGWNVTIRAIFTGGKVEQTKVKLSYDSLNALYNRILRRAGASALVGISFEPGSGSSNDAHDFTSYYFHPLTGEQTMRFAIDSTSEALIAFDYEKSYEEEGYLYYCGTPNESFNTLGSVIADELLNLIAEKTAFDRVSSFTFVIVAPEYRQNDNFYYKADVLEDGSILISGNYYSSSSRKVIEGENLPVSQELWSKCIDNLTGLDLLREDPDGFEIVKYDNDWGENTLTVMFDDGTTFSKTVGSRERYILSSQLYYVLRQGLEDSGAGDEIK